MLAVLQRRPPGAAAMSRLVRLVAGHVQAKKQAMPLVTQAPLVTKPIAVAAAPVAGPRALVRLIVFEIEIRLTSPSGRRRVRLMAVVVPTVKLAQIPGPVFL